MTLILCNFCGKLIPIDGIENHRYYCQKREYFSEIRDRLRFLEDKKKGKILDKWL